MADFKAHKKDPTQIQTDKVIMMLAMPTISQAGNEVLKVEFTTEYRTFTVWYHDKIKPMLDKFNEVTQSGLIQPETVTYRKKGDFYRVYGYNEVIDEMPEMQ